MVEDKYLNIEVVTPQKKIFEGKAESVNVPGSHSPFEILYNHAPIVSSLDTGIIRIVNENSEKLFYTVSSGFIENRDNRVSILVENAVDSSEVDKSEQNAKLKEIKEQIATEEDSAKKEVLKKKALFIENQLRSTDMS